MNKKCHGCVFETFRQDDKFQTYGFCNNEFWKSLKIQSKPYNRFIMDDGQNYAAHAIYEMQKYNTNKIPACIIVQAFFEENCPYYEKTLDKKQGS